MNNTEKLLRAFIEASGYDIEEVAVGFGTCDCFNSNPACRAFSRGCSKCHGTGIAQGEYDYKVTKRDNKELIDSIEWAVDTIRSEFGCVDEEALAAFEKAGWVNKGN